jgi:hypothetical protein
MTMRATEQGSSRAVKTLIDSFAEGLIEKDQFVSWTARTRAASLIGIKRIRPIASQVII